MLVTIIIEYQKLGGWEYQLDKALYEAVIMN